MLVLDPRNKNKKEATDPVSNVFKKVEESLHHIDEEGLIDEITEFDAFFKQRCRVRAENPLKWWAKKGSYVFPRLSNLARYVLAIHVSTVSVEACNSDAGQFLLPERSSLADVTFERLVVARSINRFRLKRGLLNPALP